MRAARAWIVYILDTDHVSLLQRGNAAVVTRVAALAATDVAITMITADEQLQGRLTVIRRARTQIDAARGYERLYETLRFYGSVALVLYDAVAARFDDLRRQGIRIGTQDLRIAAIALTQGATLVTRNTRDFSHVPGLITEDWSQSTAA
jgi:tRNA(fMet)-specific endonuclease VapC